MFGKVTPWQIFKGFSVVAITVVTFTLSYFATRSPLPASFVTGVVFLGSVAKIFETEGSGGGK